MNTRISEDSFYIPNDISAIKQFLHLEGGKVEIPTATLFGTVLCRAEPKGSCPKYVFGDKKSTFMMYSDPKHGTLKST